MKDLQQKIVAAICSAASNLGQNAVVVPPIFSKEFSETYVTISIPEYLFTATVFPRDANFWDELRTDERFERVDFESDDDMCRAVSDAFVSWFQRTSAREPAIANRGYPPN